MNQGGLELWGGVECTVNRVGDQYFDQMERSGHAGRLDDLDRFADLGLRTLRYPLLWERIAPDGLARADWRWADARMERLRTLGIRPIVGLVHHGSGPRHTNLLDPAFPELLAEFARAVAARYPWVDAYTPVNEPLTTARFAALYGHWYPHARDERAFLRALLHQCVAVARAMAAIRTVNPAAQLIQTEDLGKTTSTPALAYQAEFDNERRWLTFDLLTGRLDQAHPLWPHIAGTGLDDRLLATLRDAPCPPDVIGLNYYVTGERFLDHRVERYPPPTHGGNGHQVYADVEAVRVLEQGIAGPAALVREVWDRYHLPLAITEAQLSCTREEQMRWLLDVWHEASALRRSGVDLRAVTVWSLLGTFDWHCLVTRREDRYETGVFDVRAPALRSTALAAMVSALAANRPPTHPVLDQPGWWRRDTRLLYPAVPSTTHAAVDRRFQHRRREAARSLLIVGAGDPLERMLLAACAERGIPYRLLRPDEVDSLPATDVVAWLERQRGWAIIDLTSGEQFAAAQAWLTRSPHPNLRRATRLADACARLGLALLMFSSDQVFAGGGQPSYGETAPIAPDGVSGYLRAAIERAVMQLYPAALVVRTNPLFGWQDLSSFHARLTAAGEREGVSGEPAAAFPLTAAPDLLGACLDLLIDGEQGALHLTHPDQLAVSAVARIVAHRLEAPPGGADRDGPRPATPPITAAPRALLHSERVRVMPVLADALAAYIATAPVAAPRPEPYLARTGSRR